MTETETFLASVLSPFKSAETRFHNGDVGPRMAMWSQNDPVTLYGAWLSGIGWEQVGPAFERVASQFSNCQSYEFEVVAAGASGDLAYLVGVERTTASIDASPRSYSLRSTTVFRRENGEWKAVHRHADPAGNSGPLTSRSPASARSAAGR